MTDKRDSERADRIDIGPQPSGDNRFTARMRLHQSWYRATVLGMPCGTGPHSSSTTHYGNMLQPEDARRGLNFLTPEIFQVVREKLKRGDGLVEEFRVLHNMLSSQPMCFNLFGPMVRDHDLATAVFRRIIPGEIERVTRVEIEYAPEPKGEYLDDRTAFDAFVEYDRADGTRGFVGIETKLTEPFSREMYDGDAYRRWVKHADSPWPEASWPRLAELEHNQLWRDHLLAIAMLKHAESAYESGFFMLVRHGLDTHCESVVTSYSHLLKPNDTTFIDCPLDRLVADIKEAAGPPGEDWVAGLRARYIDLDRSEAAGATGQ